MIFIGPVTLFFIIFLVLVLAGRGAFEKKIRLEFDAFESRYMREHNKPLPYSFAEFWQFTSKYMQKFRVMRALAALFFLSPLVFFWLSHEAGKGWDRNETLEMFYMALAFIFLALGFVGSFWVDRKFGKRKFEQLIANFESTVINKG